jgi:hypothetical protein
MKRFKNARHFLLGATVSKVFCKFNLSEVTYEKDNLFQRN